MAKKKKIQPAASSEIVGSLLSAMNDGVSGENRTYMFRDHASREFGYPIPHLAVQYLIGSSAIWPLRRYISTSGAPKSFKSTFQVEAGLWAVDEGGVMLYIDNEHGKTSASMLDAMRWHRYLAPLSMWGEEEREHAYVNEQGDAIDPDGNVLIKVSENQMLHTGRDRFFYRQVDNMEEWQVELQKVIAWAKSQYEAANGDLSKLVPIYGVVDSLTGSGTEAEEASVAKEGFAEQRGFGGALRASGIANFLRSTNLGQTLMSIGYVRHMKEQISDGPQRGDRFKEAGGADADFRASLALRFQKLGGNTGNRFAEHAAMPVNGPPVTGYSVLIKPKFSCLGDDLNRALTVDVLWQYVTLYHPTEGRQTKQVMKWDWDGALGRLLYGIKYDDKVKAYAYEKEELAEALHFVKTKTNYVKCEELGLENASLTEFGQAVERNPEVRKRISQFLKITRSHSTFRDVDLAAYDA